MCGPLEHAQPPYFYLLGVSVRVKAALNRLNDNRGSTLCVREQTCMLPRELIWEGVAPPQ